MASGNTSARSPQAGTLGQQVPLLAPLGALLAVVLPYGMVWLDSPDALRESKVAAQAVGAALVLIGLAAARPAAGPSPERPQLSRLRPAATLSLTLFVVLVLVSALAALPTWLDPYTLGAVLGPVALFLWGASPASKGTSGRFLPVLAWAGAATAALAALQRFAGILRLPVDAPEARFWATALIGNPGDVGASLVLPALLFWSAASVPGSGSPWRRVPGLLGLAVCLAGLAATATVTPLLAVAVGALIHLLLAPRKRFLPFAIAAGVLSLAVVVTGTGKRLVEKATSLAEGDISETLTERNIGLLAGAEMVRGRPLLGVGPGSFSNAFVPARLEAERRAGRRLIHSSTSAHFDNAHSEPLTLAAECGLPAAAAAGTSFVLLLAALGILTARDGRPDADPWIATPGLLLVLTAAVFVLGLGSFPLRIPTVSGPTAFLLGTAWRLAGFHPQWPARPGIRKARVTLFSSLAVLLVALVAARATAIRYQATGEKNVKVAARLPVDDRREVLDRAEADLRTTVSLSPRRATARLAFGSALLLSGDRDRALRENMKSLSLEERAETDLNLGRIFLLSGEEEKARALFVRAIWIFPRLLPAVPLKADPMSIAREVESREKALGSGSPPPPLPVVVRSRWP